MINNVIEIDNATKETQGIMFRIINKVYDSYANSNIFKNHIMQEFIKKERSLLLTVIVEIPPGYNIYEASNMSTISETAIHFGVKAINGVIQKFNPKNKNDFTVQCILDQDTFINLLIGIDEQGNDFDPDYAFAAKRVILVGIDWFAHSRILTEMFIQFRSLINTKELIKMLSSRK